MTNRMKARLFSLGQLVATPACLEHLREHDLHPLQLVTRHATGDFGDLCPEDKQANEAAIKDGSRVFSAYEVGNARVYVITTAIDDSGRRESTCVLLADEY